jgi:hypothetical protein
MLTQEMMLTACVDFFALKYRDANCQIKRLNVECEWPAADHDENKKHAPLDDKLPAV